MLINILDNQVMEELAGFEESFDTYLAERGVTARERASVQAEVDAFMRKSDLCMMVKNARDARGLTQQQLATLSRVPQGEISKIERSKGNPTYETIGRLADALGLEVALVPIGTAINFDVKAGQL